MPPSPSSDSDSGPKTESQLLWESFFDRPGWVTPPPITGEQLQLLESILRSVSKAPAKKVASKYQAENVYRC